MFLLSFCNILITKEIHKTQKPLPMNSVETLWKKRNKEKRYQIKPS